jgi:hypothetical protein
MTERVASIGVSKVVIEVAERQLLNVARLSPPARRRRIKKAIADLKLVRDDLRRLR